MTMMLMKCSSAQTPHQQFSNQTACGRKLSDLSCSWTAKSISLV